MEENKLKDLLDQNKSKKENTPGFSQSQKIVKHRFGLDNKGSRQFFWELVSSPLWLISTLFKGIAGLFGKNALGTVVDGEKLLSKPFKIFDKKLEKIESSQSKKDEKQFKEERKIDENAIKIIRQNWKERASHRHVNDNTRTK